MPSIKKVDALIPPPVSVLAADDMGQRKKLEADRSYFIMFSEKADCQIKNFFQ